MNFTTRVTLTTDGTPTRPLSGVRVALYDCDTFTPDDHRGTEVTDDKGEACFRFSSEDFTDFDDRFGGSNPDLYVIVYDADGETVHSTRSEVQEGSAQSQLKVCIPADVASQHKLLGTTG